MKVPRRVIEAATERLNKSQAERSRVKQLVQDKNIVEANEPDVLERRINHITDMQAVASNIQSMPGSNELIARTPIRHLSRRGRVTLERFIGDINDLLPGYFLPLGTQIRRTVGRITVVRDGMELGHGTGFLVSPRLLMTNNHVFSSAEDAAESYVEFDYETGRDKKFLPTFTFRFKPEDFFITDPVREDGGGLDYTIVAVESLSEPDSAGRRTPLSTLGFNRLRAKIGKIIKGEAINIIQHPSGEARQYCLQNNKLLEFFEDNWLHYESDTLPGSSGSALYNNQWEVVGLHHSGVPKKNANGDWLKRDGSVADEDTDDSEIDWIANEGARISSILTNAARQVQQLGQSQQDLFKDLLTPPNDSTPQISENGTNSNSNPLKPPQVGESDQEDNSDTPKISDTKGIMNENRNDNQRAEEITVTVPVTITIRVGNATATTVSGISSGKVSTPVTSKDSVTDVTSDTRVTEAVKEFERFDPARYLDKTKYAEAQAEYYADITWSASGDTLYQTLSELVESTHKTKPKYAPARELYPSIDRHPRGQLISIYTGQEFDNPRELIRRELAQQIEIERKVELMRRSEASLNEASLQEFALALEAQKPFNCEHVVPQSWFAKKEPMRGDLHHLFACQVQCNSARSNIPYFDFPDFPAGGDEVSAECGKREGNKFEPRRGKGAVARATLYFLLRYPGQIDNIAGELQENRLQTIVKWATDDRYKVEDYERHRNQEIFAKQGNRNPLIDLFDLQPDDYKDIIERIQFSAGLG